MNLQTKISGQTDPGMLRSRNEDALTWNESMHLAILADGMGGHNAGDVASNMALEIIQDNLYMQLPKLDQPDSGRQRIALLLSIIAKTNAHIYQAAQTNTDKTGMGSTLALTLFHRDKIIIAHIGDSRVYRLRNHRLKALTHDHSLVNQLIAQGTMTKDEAKTSQYRNVITRALGHKEKAEPEIRMLNIMPKDIYLLCSDGLYDMMSERDIRDIVIREREDLGAAANQLIVKANESGGKDNVTALLVEVEANP